MSYGPKMDMICDIADDLELNLMVGTCTATVTTATVG